MWQLPFTDFKELTSERLNLRQIDKNKDLDAIFQIRSNPEVLKYLDRDPPNGEAEIIDFISRINNGFVAGENVSWGITLKGDDRLIGDFGFWRIIKEHHRAEIGYTLHPDFWGKGIMDEVMKAALPFAFDVMNLHSIEANINPNNKRSKGLLLKNGFVKEAYFRENFYENGVFLDSEIYSLIKPK